MEKLYSMQLNIDDDISLRKFEDLGALNDLNSIIT